MSRTSLKPKPLTALTEVVVGFDAPLGAWFYQIWEGGDEPARWVLRCTREQLLDVIEAHCDTSDEVVARYLSEVESAPSDPLLSLVLAHHEDGRVEVVS